MVIIRLGHREIYLHIRIQIIIRRFLQGGNLPSLVVINLPNISSPIADTDLSKNL